MNKKIIITRDRKTAAPLIALLKEEGIISYVVPVMKVVYDLSKKLPSDINNFNWVAFTSANGVRAFVEILKKADFEIEDNMRIASVGSSTAVVVEDRLRKKSIVPETGNGVSLAELILRENDDPRNLRVLWPCGEDALLDFENVMVGAGAVVTRWVCYRSEEIEKDIIRSKLESLIPWDLVFFAAPSAVEAFSAAWEGKSDFIVVAIGPTTAEALRIRGYDNIITSVGTSVSECSETIVNALKEQARG